MLVEVNNSILDLISSGNQGLLLPSHLLQVLKVPIECEKFRFFC